ncbi:MAG: DNA polymerase I [Acetobacter sp.]|nr:DNA polymerase I [Acetobacter sp.]
MTEKVCLIDGSGYIFRAFFASPKMTNPEGLPVNAVYGFLNMFLSLTANIKCDYCLVLFDAKRQNFRNEFFAEYKATRPELPEDLKPQFALIHEVVEALNLHWLQMEGYEADDLIATYADIALKEGMDVTIVSADKDLMQLIRPGVKFYDSMKNKFFTPEDVKEKFGVYPERVTDVQSLAGDSTDNIPGVPGIGLKTAAELINQFGSLTEVLNRAEEIKQNKRRELIMTHKEDALVSQKLVTLKPDVPVELPLKDLRCIAPHQDVLLNLLDRHAFKSLKNKALNWLKQKCADLPEEQTSSKELTPEYKLIQTPNELQQLTKQIQAENMFAFQTIMDKEHLLGLAISLKNAKAFYIPLVQSAPAADLFSAPTTTGDISLNELKQFILPLFNAPEILKIALNIKENIHQLANAFQTELTPFPYDDVAILSYDLYSASVTHTLPALAAEFLQKSLKMSEPEYKKTDFSTLPATEALTFFAEMADYTMRLHQLFRPELQTEKKLFVYDGIDRPLSAVLYQMERAGIMLDTHRLTELNTLFDKEMNSLSAEIYTLAGEEFNLSSPKQIGEILYTKLGLKGKKHTSGSLNTSAEVLEKMAEEHELPRKILEWRQYQKLKSTYTTALLGLMDKNSRVHTTYSQISVNTGRLSSLNPNLQNIPIRTPIGREIRKCFIAKPKHKLIAADYSQVELRLLATIADVPFLQQAFKENVDIHRKTAAQVFGIPYDEVDSEHRRRAKAINFGIVYGMSAFGLSKEIDVTPAEASRYIDAYFANMPEVKTYMDETINFARQNGYVLTPLNRKITIFGIQDNNKRLASFAERAAINAPIQGGAADIIKLAMNKIPSKLKAAGLKAQMLLQVHDELVFEAPEEEVEQTAALIKQEMENITALTLKTPLIAEVGVGDNWDEAH